MKSESRIRKAQSWEELFSTLQSLPAKEKGDVFERVVQLYLKTHPEYESILSNVWTAHARSGRSQKLDQQT